MRLMLAWLTLLWTLQAGATDEVTHGCRASISEFVLVHVVWSTLIGSYIAYGCRNLGLVFGLLTVTWYGCD